MMMELLFVPIVRGAVPGSRWSCRAPGWCMRWSILAFALLAVAACDQFSAAATVETCVLSAMKHGEPYGNDKERTDTESQLRHYCALAAARKGM